MDPLASPKEDSEDPILPELLPVKSKDSSKTEDSVIMENCLKNETSDVKDEKMTNATNDKKINNVPEMKESTTLESPESSREIEKEIIPIKTEENVKNDSLLLQTDTNKLGETVNAKMTDVNKSTNSQIAESKDVKRKRRTTSDQQDETTVDDVETRVKRVRTKNINDNYCWRCHKDGIDARCSACPRSWHRKCMGGSPPTSINETWICGECATILRAENAETRSEVVAHMSIDHLCMLLKYIVERMRSCQGSEPFWKPVDLNEVQNYMDYVVKPMDLNLLEANVRAKLYGSTDAFMADAKWIQHNCIVFNTCGGVYADTSKLTNAAKQIIKTAKQEVAEIEACPDCYARGRNLPRPNHMWFIEACRRPHPLIWAKLKGFPFWPAKAMPRVNGQGHVDVRFFGQHDRAWVAPKDVYLYSRDPPAPMPRKRKAEMAECIKEITRHCRKLEMVFGPFQFAPAKTPYIPNDPTQIKIMLPQYDPLRTNDYSPSSGTVTRRKSPFRKRNSLLKRRLDSETATTDESTVESSTKDSTVLLKTETSNDVEKTNNITITEKIATSEQTRPRKRLRKSLNNVETKLTTEDKEPSSPIQVIETSSTSTIDDNTVKLETVSNGSSESHGTPVIKVANQAKLKNEKTVVPLEKSLAALLRKVNPKGRLTHPRNSTMKPPSSHNNSNSSKIENKASLIKVYKPKARMVDKVNAEKALKSTHEKEHDKLTDGKNYKMVEAKMINGILTYVPIRPGPNSTSQGNAPPSGDVALLHDRRNNTYIITSTLLEAQVRKMQPSVLVANNGTSESKQAIISSDEIRPKTTDPVTIRIKPEPHVSPPVFAPAPQEKQSRAKKSFPNKAPRLPQLLPKLPKPPANSLDTMVYIPASRNENGLDYQLPPPEAGPLSSQLHRSANEMVKRMAQFMEEAIKEAADSSSNETGNAVDSHQATIHSLRLQIERMRWQHQQQLAELKHNTDRKLKEMRASLEAERLRAIEEVRKAADEDKARCIEDTKAKQWCSQCGREALFYCCWNTAYCDHLCQQAHWQSHQRKCAQKPSSVSNSSGDSGNKQQQKIRMGGKANSGIETIDVSKSKSGGQSSNVITKYLKIP